ncbi:MAG: hypothetical protein II748_06415 [Clostridia bacterium]|nr:hypothetical protein [Clostridia bacterium]
MGHFTERIKKITVFLVAAVVSVSCFCGCSTKYNDRGDGMKIDITDERNVEKVITDRKFKKPELQENNGSFTITALFKDHMVLQANMAGRIWGNYWGYDETAWIALEIKNDKTGRGKTFYGETDKNGDFEIWFSPFDYGGPYTVTLYDKDGNSVEYADVLFGEVFVLGGQSNMGWAIGQCYDKTTEKLLYQDIIDSSYNDDLRAMLVWPVSSKKNVDYLSSARPWTCASPESIPEWSACGYFFGKRLNELFNVPVGLVGACMGGTPISAWNTTGEWYMGVVNPVKRLVVRGVCWYQGEGDYSHYAERLEALIAEWRSEFENPNLYWAAVEMPRHISDEQWALCRDEVSKLNGKVDKYTSCTTLDTGLYPEWTAEGDPLNGDGIHPYEKLKVGERLADAAAQDFYGAKGTWRAAYMTEATRSGNKITFKFDNVGDGLTLVGKNGFMVKSGNDFTSVEPKLIDKNTVEIDISGIEGATAVWYGIKNYRGEGITRCADSVCVYNTKDGEAAYPAQQFRMDLS